MKSKKTQINVGLFMRLENNIKDGIGDVRSERA